MPCPRCGSWKQRRQIAPGYWECKGIRPHWINVPDPMFAGRRGKWELIPVLCNTRYQEGSLEALDGPTEYCRCNTFAIGRCWVCQRSVCGLHSSYKQGSLRCDACARAMPGREQ